LKCPLNDLLDRLCSPLDDDPRGSVVDNVHPTAVVQALIKAKGIESFVQACKDPSEVKTAVAWFFIEVGRLIVDDPLYPPEDSIQRAERLLRTEMANYQRLAIEWWRFNPWIVAFVRGRDKPTGMSICLPVTESHYEAVLRGDKMTYECAAADLRKPSTTFIHEAIARRPAELGAANPSTGIAVLATSQTGILAYGTPKRGRKPVRVLSPGGTSSARVRLTQFGYEATGIPIKNTGVELYQLQIDQTSYLGDMLGQSLQWIGKSWRGPPPP
jgi:hypothetical protein